MGRLVWFGVVALSPAGALVAIAAVAAAGYVAGQRNSSKKK